MSLFDKGKAASKSISDKTKSAVDHLNKDAAATKEAMKDLSIEIQTEAAENAEKLKENAKAQSDAVGDKVHDAVDSLSDQIGDRTERVKSKITDVITTLKDKADIIAKDIEGKLQESKGAVMGNSADKVSGEVKQADAALESKVEDVKDNVKKSI